MKSLTYVAVLTLSALLSACGNGEATENSSQSTQVSNPTTTNISDSKNSLNKNVYVSPLPDNAPTYEVVTFEFIPYAFKDEYGNPIGYDIDLLHAISEEQGVKFNFTEEPYSQVQSLLQAGKYDLLMSGFLLLPERQRLMESGDTYSQSRIGHIVKADSPYQKAKELNSKKIAVLKNSPPHKILIKMGLDKTNMLFVDGFFLSFQSALNGNADAGSGVEANISYYAQQYPENPIRFLPFTEPYPTTVYAPKGKTELIKIFNEGLAKIRANGKYQKINKKWFGDYADLLMVK